jgi:hypothetical protein
VIWPLTHGPGKGRGLKGKLAMGWVNEPNPVRNENRFLDFISSFSMAQKME